MDAQAFWHVISLYNSDTLLIQIVLFLFLISTVVLSYFGKVKWLAKLSLGIVNLFIGIIFFGIYGIEPIQIFFAFPLFLCCGCLFIYESIKNKNDTLSKPNKMQSALFLLYALYPFISMLLGNRFPQMVTYIMPCPLINLSIAIYSCYNKKNRLLMLLLMIWGLTGIKSIIFNAYEDIILLVCGIYVLFLIMREKK